MQQGMVGLQNQAQNPNFPQQRQQNQQWSTANVNLLEHGHMGTIVHTTR
jgi:hypothetical protein